MSHYTASSFEEAMIQFIECIEAVPPLPIFLVGSGGNGKTALVHKCLENLQLANRTVARPGHPKYKQEMSPLYVYEVYSESDVVLPSHVIDMNKVKFK